MEVTIYKSNGTVRAAVGVNDSSSQEKSLMGDNVLTLSFTHYSYIRMDVNDYVDFHGERYWLMERYAPVEKNGQEWVYDVKMYGIESMTQRLLVLNTVDGESEPVFTLTAPASEHLRLIVASLNDGMGSRSWAVGTVDAGDEMIVMDYEGMYCGEALKALAEKAETEWWIEGTTVNLCRCERGERLSLCHGEGLVGLDPGKADNVKVYTRLYVIGSSKNIDAEDYGHSRLMLPNGARYVDVNVDKYGVIHHYEQAAFSGIFPRRIGEVSSVRWEPRTGDDGSSYRVYYFKDNALPFNPNNQKLEGEVMRVSFQTGDLAGLGESDDHYFEVNYDSSRGEFELITIWPYGDDTSVPNAQLNPSAGDTYILWNIRMPREYYALAEAELASAAAEYNEKHAMDVSVYKSKTDYVWMGEQDEDLDIGRRVTLVDANYFDGGERESRVTKIVRKVNEPLEMDIEVGDCVGSGTLSKISDDIGEVKNYARSVKNGVTLPDIIKSGDNIPAADNNLYSAKRSRNEFLSKTGDDAAAGRITFNKGIAAHDDGDNPSIDAETIEADEVNATAIEGGSESISGNSSVGSSTVSGNQTVGGNQTVSGTSRVNTSVVNGNQLVGGDMSVSGGTSLKDTEVDGEMKSKDAVIDYDNIDFTNSGWGLRKDGTLNVNAIIARSYAMFPELRLNRITAQTGVTWITAGNGRVKSVSHTSASNVGTITLDLDIEKNGQTAASDYGTLRAGDWCIGIYHYASGNAQGDNDDSTYGLTVRGFSTIYLHVESVTGSHGETVAYKLYNQAGQALANLSSNVHPCAMMNIVAFGSNTDTTRQKSMYVTTTRAKYLFGVNSIPSLWNTDKVGMMLGDLSGITIDGRQLTAYSAYLNNIYMKGVIKQIDPNRPSEEIEVLNYMGNWTSGVTYFKNDEVWYDDALWVAKSQTTSTPSDTYWKKVSAVGKNGTSYRPKGNGRQISSTSVSGTLGEIGYYNRTIYERKSTGWSALTGMELGDAYFIKMIDANLGTHVIYWDGISWNDLGNIQGPKGDTGLTGKSLTDVVTWYNYTTSADEYPTGQGQTTPYEWVDGRYIWQRRQYNWLNSDGTTDTTYDAWVNTTGSRGGNGTTPIVADVSPLLNSVPTDEEGKISAAQTLDLQLHIYEGVSPLDITGLMVDGTTILSYGSSWTNIRSNKLSVQRIMTNNRITGCRIRVNANTAQDRTYDIPIVLNRSSQSATGGYELTYTLECPRAAHSGVSPTVYSIATTEQNIKKGKSGSLVTTTITALVHKVSEGTLTDLDTTTKLTSEGLSMYFKRQNGTEHQVTQSNLTLTVSLTGSDSGSQVAIGTDQYVDIYAKRDGIKISALRIYVLSEPKEISSITMRYYLSTSPTARQGGTERTDYPEWQNGKYLWWKQRATYTDGTYTETDWVCNAGSQGETGASGQILRMRGEWNNTAAYCNDATYVDVVLYNGNYYKAKQNSTGQSPAVGGTTYWDEFNQFVNLATSVLLANQGYVDVLGSGRLFVGQTETSDGWEMTQGKIRHTQTGLELTSDGKLYDPTGVSIKVGEVYAGSNPNLLPDPFFETKNNMWLNTDATPSGLSAQYVSSDYASWGFTSGKLHGKWIAQYTLAGNTTSLQYIRPNMSRIKLKMNTTYTFSVNEWHPSNVSSLKFYIRLYTTQTGSSMSSKLVTINGASTNPHITSYTFTTDATHVWFDFYFYYTLKSGSSSQKCYIDSFKLEEGSVPTEMNDNISEALLATGIDIIKRELLVTADKFKVRNNDGMLTFYVNKRGDIMYSGSQIRQVREIDFSDPDSKSRYLIQGIADNKPAHSQSSLYGFDALANDGVFMITNAPSGTALYLPYCIEISGRTHYTRVKTVANNTKEHLITMNELKGLLGRKLVFMNDSDNNVTIDIGAKMGYSDHTSVDNRIVYLSDDNGFYGVFPTSSYPSGGNTYYNGDITLYSGEVLVLELCIGAVTSNSTSTSIVAGYYWRYNKVSTTAMWNEDV